MTAVYNEANRMMTYNDENLVYDENGNLIQKGDTTYTWNARNQLIAIDSPTYKASFKYDALGRRIEKTVNGKTTQYLYDGLDIVQEIENGMVTVNYLRTLNIDEPLALVNKDEIYYYMQDGLGSVIGLTDSSGKEVVQYYYDPFGNTVSNNPTFKNPFQYTGRENDETGLYYYRFRYYSPELQRFTSEDPIGLLSGDINFYVYVFNSPLNLSDPEGKGIISFFKCRKLSKKYDKLWEECKREQERKKPPECDLKAIGEYTNWTFDLNEPIRRCIRKKDPDLVRNLIKECGFKMPLPTPIPKIPRKQE